MGYFYYIDSNTMHALGGKIIKNNGKLLQEIVEDPQPVHGDCGF